MPLPSSIPDDRLLRYAVKVARRVHARINSRLRFHPEAALQRISDPEKDPHNQPLRLDYYAEDYYSGALEKRFKERICAVGEETLERRPDLKDITNRKEVFALLDIIDGTDLLLRQFGNWCSAIVFFYPPSQDILLSLVVDHEANIFYATRAKSSAYFFSKRCKSLDEAVPLQKSSSPPNREEACIRFLRNRPSGPVPNVGLSDASVCFVGQKPPYFLAAAKNDGLCKKLAHLSKMLRGNSRPAPAFRIYNLGGIPMMPKVANGILDAVVGLQRSKPHDFVAGAFIGLKAGAFLGDMQGNTIGEADLARWLNQPEERCTPYILSGTQALYDELLESLRVEGTADGNRHTETP